MIFLKTDSPTPAADHLLKVIQTKLGQNQKVAWVITGGSSMTVVLDVAKRLTGDLSGLTVFLTDERYGHVSHSDSNWAYLEENGFKLSGAKLIPTLVDRALEETVKLYEKAIEPYLTDTSIYKLAMAGIGADGHTFGIKPKSPAVFSKELVSGYRGDDFTRITLTPEAIGRMDEIVGFVMGEEKHPILDDLEKELPLVTQPAQALKQVKKLTIYNDYKGEAA